MFRIFYDRVIGYTADDQKIRREPDPIWQNNFQGLSQFCPDGDRDRDDYWCRKFLQISTDTSAINTIINEWSLNGDKKGTVEQLLRKAPNHLAIALEHYCEKATEQVFRDILIFQYKKELMENPQLDQEKAAKIARSRAHNQLERQRIKAPVGLFKQVLQRTNQPYQKPSANQFLFTEIQSIHQCTVFAQFDLKRNNPLENWAVYRLYKRTADEMIRKYDPERRNNPWQELYNFCREFLGSSPEERKITLKNREIPEHSVKYYTELILVFAQMYVPEQEIRNNRPQPRYRDPNNELLQRMANEFNRRLSLRKDAKEMKDQLLVFYQTYLSNDPPLNIDTLDNTQENDDGSASTKKDVLDYNIPPSAEATELKEQLPNLIAQLDNTPERPYQVLLLLQYGFKDKLFMAEDEDGEGNVQLNETEIGRILGLSGHIQSKVSRRKTAALTRLINLIRELSSERELNLDVIAETKKLLEKQLLPDYYFSLIRSWIVDDLAKIPITAVVIIGKIPERPNEELNCLKVKVMEKITEEIKRAGFDLSPEGLALLEPPINRLVEVYARVTPEQR